MCTTHKETKREDAIREYMPFMFESLLLIQNLFCEEFDPTGMKRSHRHISTLASRSLIL